MLVINSEDITDLDQAREAINELQLRLFRSEKCLDDLARGLEIAYYTRNFESLEQFRAAAEDQLKDRLEFDHTASDEGDAMKITILK